MSGQWEVVRSKSEKRSKLPVAKNSNQQADSKPKKSNKILNGVKLEEVLPKSQVQSLYSSKQANKENKSQDKPKLAEYKKSKSSKASSEAPKAKPVKSIEAGLLSINPEEFNIIYERSKAAFPDAPIVWLKELTQYLNQKIPIEIQDPVFSNKPSGYPLNVMPSTLKVTLEKAMKEAGKGNSQLYFDIALTSMVTDLSKGLPGVGYRFFLQYIALKEPKLVVDNLSKHVSLRNSYQNRANVALSILWAVGHAGINDLHCGLKVFEDLKLPLIEMKSYTRYIAKYLFDLTSRNYENVHLTKDQYLLILDTVYSAKKNFPLDIQKDLIRNLPKMKNLLFNNNKESLNNLVDAFLKQIAATSNKAYQNHLCDILIDIFAKDQTTLGTWNKVYSKNLMASAILLRHISDNYGNIKPNLRKSLKKLFINFETVNEELALKKRKDDGLKEAVSALKKVQEQRDAPKKSGNGIFRKLFSALLFLAWIAILTEPFYRPNKPRDDLYVFRFGRKISETAQWADGKLEQAFPQSYYSQAKTFARPYGALAGDLLKVFIKLHDNVRGQFAGFVNEKYPIVVASIDNYAPGLIDNTQVIFRDAFAKSIYYYHNGVNYLQKEVFVGQLSPESIQRAVVRAYNTTSEKAVEYYHWVYEKVQTSIK